MTNWLQKLPHLQNIWNGFLFLNIVYIAFQVIWYCLTSFHPISFFLGLFAGWTYANRKTFQRLGVTGLQETGLLQLTHLFSQLSSSTAPSIPATGTQSVPIQDVPIQKTSQKVDPLVEEMIKTLAQSIEASLPKDDGELTPSALEDTISQFIQTPAFHQ